MKFLSDIEVEQGADTTFVDNAKALFGNSSDLQIYHDGSNSYINESGTGSLFLQASDIFLKTNTSENAIACGNNGAVTLYYDNAAKLATTSAGVTVTGDLTVSGGDITLSGTGRIQGVDTVSATTDAANKAYVDAVNVGVTQITAGTNVTISPSGGTGNVTINASGGGGSGTIGGTIENQEIAVGTAQDEIGGQAYFTWSAQNGLVVGNHSQTGGANNITIDRPSSLPGKFIIKQNNTTEFSIVTGGGSTTISSNTNNLILTDDTTAKVGVGNTSPTEKLDVTGRIKASKGVQVGAEADGDAAAGLVGTFRYRTYSDASFDYSAIDVCMQDGAGIGDYNWVNIVTNRW